MATTPTTGEIPSNAAVDLKFNSEQFDRVMNSDDLTYTDRFGKKRITMKGVQELANGFQNTFTNLLGSPNGFKLIGKVSSISALSILPGKDGDHVLVKGYNEGSELGGGEFYYSSASALVNNGVTIINGWVKKTPNNILTDYDCGRLPGDTSDASQQLSNLFACVQPGMTVYIFCDNYVSRNFVITNIPNIKIVGMGGSINAWLYRDNFNWNYNAYFEKGNDVLYGSLGILSFYNCPDSTVFRMKITGAQKIIPQSKEWGDCAIRYENCKNFKIISNTFKHFGGWGVFGGFGSDYSECAFNYISNVHRQSGINIFANSSYCNAHDNILVENGLYGGEVETFGRYDNAVTKGNSFVRNFIDRAKIGICAVGSISDADISDNVISNCLAGTAAIGLTNTAGTRVHFNRNTIRSSWYGMSVNNSKGVAFIENTVDYTDPDFIITDQYQAPVKLVDGDNYSFYCTLPIAANKIIKIADSVYTVASYTAVDSTTVFGVASQYGLSTFYKITLTTALQSDFYTFANILFGWSTLNTTVGTYGIVTNNTALSQANVVDGANNVSFTGNKIFGVKYGIWPNNTYSALTGVQESYSDNTFRCESWLKVGSVLGAQVGIYDNNPSVNTSLTSLVTGSDTTNWKGTKTRTFISNTPTVAGSAFPTNQFMVDKTCFVIGYRVILSGWSATENIQLVIANPNEKQTITTGTSGVNTGVEIRKHLYALSPGNIYPVYLLTANKTAAVNWSSIEVFLLE